MAQITLQGRPVQVEGPLLSKGEKAPDFRLVDKSLQDLSLRDLAGKRKLLSFFPSVDDATCAASVRKLNGRAGDLANTAVLCVSADLPFTHSRFCSAEGLDNVITLSTLRAPHFLQQYGVQIAGGPLAGVAATAVVVLDERDVVLHSQFAADVAAEPDYDAAFAVLK
ncbi:putative thiol peroxidase [Streptomyces minutiscleroticus]|uniref:Thiol peroxidase n=1 Tax=Streptomyces minutiscleroticus TaxID=68238 RepID=A0A918NY72_9ACTN|nr:thiol peroxidase [Streptomyces minutiscleroticus]GGY05321.1 putative thiol peroxidase [Streptomyces minutiscleroticus]